MEDHLADKHGPGEAVDVADEEHKIGPATGSEGESSSSKPLRLVKRALRVGRVEENGIRPLTHEERKETRFYKIFTLWLSINSNILG